MIRWKLRLQEYDFQIVHISGKSNVIADPLSRLFLALSDAAETGELDNNHPLVEATHKQWFTRIHNGIAGHHGVQDSLERLNEMGYKWTNMEMDVSNWIKTCPICQKVSAGKASYEAARRSAKITNPNDMWSIDAIGPLPEDKDGNQYIMAAIDNFSKYVILAPAKNVTADDYIIFLIRIIGDIGFMQAIHTDQGSEFTAKVIDQFHKLVGIRHEFSVPYRHESNSIIERANKLNICLLAI